MKLALECPTSLLPSVQPLADFDWILVHKVLEDEEYQDYYSKVHRLKVLDNSVNELLEPMPLDALDEASAYVQPDLIVAPDFLGDAAKTLLHVREAIRMFGKEKVFPVIQGSNLQEVETLFLDYLSLGLERVAIPYDILSQRTDSSAMMTNNRLQVVTSLIEKAPIGLRFHLLGFTTLEELSQHNRSWVYSIDTGVPVLLGTKGYAIDKTVVDKSKPTMEQMESITTLDPDFSKQMIYWNIAYLRKILNDSR